MDPRPARTRAALRGAAQRLASEGVDVTVDTISRSAGVSRTAFYSHFDSLDALAVETLIHEFEAIGVDDVLERDAGTEGVRVIARRAARRLCHHIDAKRDFYRATLDWRLTAQAHDTIVTAFARVVAVSMAHLRTPPPGGLDADGHALYIAGGAIALIRRWVRDDDPVTPAQMTTQLLAAMPSWLVGDPETSTEGT